MTTTVSRVRRIHRDGVDADIDELCEAVLGSLRRRDQREKGLTYVRGLLATQGRKSIRNIAAQAGGSADEQSLHHFITSSTWDWQPIRAALARHLAQQSPLSAWIAQPLAIPKGGDRSVGVGHRFDPHQNTMFRGQQAFGVWFSSAEFVTPVGWRMFLPETAERGARGAGSVLRPAGGERSGFGTQAAPERAFAAACASLSEGRDGRPSTRSGGTARTVGPDGDGHEETYEESAAAAVLDTLRDLDLPPRPVLLDIRDIGTRSTLNRFAEARLPVVARVAPGTRLLVTDPAVPGHGAGTLTAQDILQSVRGLRTAVDWSDPAAPGRRRMSFVGAVRVMMPDPSPMRRRHLMLLGEWSDPRKPPSELWITDLVRPAAPALLRLTKQARRVSAAGHSAQEVGLRDFAGRSLSGWHRHVTMASVAHAARALNGTAGIPAVAQSRVAG
ncbi:IS701 family transposase [Streptomyces sp. BI20]|uniref:IS701 family transposase n=1 Tax=Streptomyces sp. BI20 TaxID=3403460 RepID=UPI003C75E69A